MASGAKHAHGTELKIGDGGAPEVFTAIAECPKFNVGGLKLDAIEVTNLSSTGAHREFIGGLLDGGEVSLSLSYLPHTTGHAQLRADQVAKTLRNFEIHWTQLSPPTKFTFSALVTSISFDVDMEKALTAEVTLKISGVPAFAAI